MSQADKPQVRPSQNNRYRKSNGPSGLRPRDQKQADSRLQVHHEAMSDKNKGFVVLTPVPGLPNRYDETAAFSTFVPYDGAGTSGCSGFQNPSTSADSGPHTTVRLTIDNMPFERSAKMATDITVLLSWMSATVVPSWARERGLPGSRQYYLKMAGMSDYDSLTMIDGRGLVAPAKKRHIFANTNIPIELIRELLKDPRLYVLADRNGFHACWDGHRPDCCPLHTFHYDAVEDGTIVSRRAVHDVRHMIAFGNTIRAKGLRDRHRFTDGLPCTSVRVDYLADRKVEGPQPINRMLPSDFSEVLGPQPMNRTLPNHGFTEALGLQPMNRTLPNHGFTEALGLQPMDRMFANDFPEVFLNASTTRAKFDCF